jgi:hypothetical protein
MVTVKEATTWALAYPEAVEMPHFEKTSFRVRKKIFGTLDKKTQKFCLKLSEVDQSVFSDFNPGVIYPVPGAWGRQGYTLIELKKVKKTVFKDALQTSYTIVAPKSLSEQFNKRQ